MKSELRTMILDYMNRHEINQVEMARRLEVQQGTLSNWLSGEHGITKKNEVRIKFVCEQCGTIKPTDAIIQPPPDHLTQCLLDEWSTLDLEERGKVIAFLGKMKAEKKNVPPSVVAG